jgi:hypothetical protein
MKIGRFLVFLICALFVGVTIRYAVGKFGAFGSIKGHTAKLTEAIPASTRALHPNYPYSIIPGGVYSPTELTNADRDDPVVTAHYADFNVKNAHMVQLSDDRYQYVSYRLRQKVYWTKKKLRIPKGELLLTDGNSWARARCGNRLSNTPHKEVSAEEPPATALLMPTMPLGPQMQFAETRAPSELASLPPANTERLAPVPPPSSAMPPAEWPPLAPTLPAIPEMPILPVLFQPVATTTEIIPPATLPPGTPGTTIIPPTTFPPGTTSLVPLPPGQPFPPPDSLPLSSVPEPKAVYLFLVTLILSLYGLTRMIPVLKKTKTANKDHG